MKGAEESNDLVDGSAALPVRCDHFGAGQALQGGVEGVELEEATCGSYFASLAPLSSSALARAACRPSASLVPSLSRST